MAAGRAIRVPIWVLDDDVNASHTTVRFELRALDAEGNASPPAIAEIDAAEVRAAAQSLGEPPDRTRAAARRLELPMNVRAVDDRYVEDVARFARAAADPETAETLALLSGDSAPPGPPNDEAFQRAVLSQPARLRIRGQLRGHEGTTVTAWVRVRDGRVSLMDAGPLRAAIAQLPLDLPEVERFELTTFEHGSGQVQAQLFLSGGDTVVGGWHPSMPTPDLRGKVERKFGARAMVDRHPVFGELVAAYGRPRRRSGESVSFGLDYFRTVEASFEIREGSVKSVRLTGPLPVLRIGPFLPLLDGVVARAELRPDPQQIRRVTMTIAEDGAVAGELGNRPEAVPFEGRLDLARMRTP